MSELSQEEVNIPIFLFVDSINPVHGKQSYGTKEALVRNASWFAKSSVHCS